MPTLLPDQTLDAILAIQFTIAWVGEGRCSPKRLGWWDTDLIDEAGGGDSPASLLAPTLGPRLKQCEKLAPSS